jgi:hypothetical protein
MVASRRRDGPPWCKGNTSDFGSDDPGSNPGGGARPPARTTLGRPIRAATMTAWFVEPRSISPSALPPPDGLCDRYRPAARAPQSPTAPPPSSPLALDPPDPLLSLEPCGSGAAVSATSAPPPTMMLPTASVSALPDKRTVKGPPGNARPHVAAAKRLASSSKPAADVGSHRWLPRPDRQGRTPCSCTRRSARPRSTP